MPVWKTLKVFVSSTFKDLELERDALAEIFRRVQHRIYERRLGLIPYDLRWRQKHSCDELVEWCLEMVEQCQYFIGILGYRYGWRPPKTVGDQANVQRLSITEIEVMRALDVSANPNRFFCFGDLSQYSSEQLTGESDEDKASLVLLQKKLEEKGERIFRYRNSDELLAIIEQNFQEIIDRDYPVGQKTPLEAPTRRQAIREIIAEKTSGFVGRTAYLERLHQFVCADDRQNYLAIRAVAGTGKSALLCRFLSECERQQRKIPVLVHIMSLGAGQIEDIHQNISEQLKEAGINVDLGTNGSEMGQALKQVDRKIVFAIDGLDEVEETGHSLQWLPRNLPASVRVLLTTRPVGPWLVLQTYPYLQVINLPQLDTEEIRQIIRYYRRSYRLEMDWKDEEILVERSVGNPLFLKVALDEILSSGLAVGQLAGTIDQLFNQILRRLESQFGHEAVEDYLGIIAASRSGVTELELREILIAGHRCSDDFLLAMNKSLANFVIQRKNLLAFFHPEFERSIKMRLGKIRMRHYYRQLADYLNARGFGYERSLSELGYLELWGKRPERAIGLLTNIEFLQAKCNAEMVNSLASDFQRALFHPEVALPAQVKIEPIPGMQADRETLRYLEKALSLDLPFIRSHPDCLLQCLWNRCYWHDAPEASYHYRQSTGYCPSPIAIHLLVDFWRRCHNSLIRLQSRKPLEPTLDSPMRKVLRGHGDWIKCVVFSPNGKLIASGSRDKILRVWDAVTGECLQVLSGHEGTVQSVSWNPDGSKLVSAASDKTLRIWETATGKCLDILSGHEEGVESVAWSPDGEKIISGGWDCHLRIWQAATGQCQQILPGHRKGVESVAWSPDCRYFASGARDHCIRIWCNASSKCIGEWTGHNAAVNCIVYRSDGNQLASASSDKTVRIWDVTSGECRHELTGHRTGVFAICYSPDGRKLVSGSSDRTLRIWDADSGRCLQVLTGHEEWVLGVGYSPDASTIVSGGGHLDKTIRLWTTRQTSHRHLEQWHQANVQNIAIHPDGTKAISGAEDGTLAVWDLESGKCLFFREQHQGRITQVLCQHRKFYSSSQDKTVRIWDIATGNCQQVLTGHSGCVESICLLGKNRLVSCSKDKTLKIWDCSSGECLKTLNGHSDWVGCLAVNAKGTQIASGSRDKTVRIWDSQTGDCQQKLSGHEAWVRDLSYHPDGIRLLSCSKDKTVRIWDGKTGACLNILSAHKGAVQYAIFNDDGDYFISCGWDKTVKIWETATGKCLETITGWADIRHMADSRVKWRAVTHAGITSVIAKATNQLIASFPAVIKYATVSSTGFLIGGSGAGYVYILAIAPRSPAV